ncbi:hypothetical protein ABBQ38_014778 [Trebouxia sp. C0009 RCD-2024]
MPLLPVFLINRPGEIPQYHQKYVVDLILEVTSDLTNKPPGLDHWQQLLAGPVVISGVQSSHVNSIQALDKWNIEHQDPQFLSSVVRWGCTLAVYAHDLLRSSGAAVAEKGRIVVMSTLVLRTFLMLSQLPRVTRDGDAFAVTMQVLTGLKYKCSLTHRPFPLVQILDSIQTKTAAAPACWVKAQEAFQECMTKAGKFLDIPGILKEPKAKEALMRVLAVDLTEIFLGSRAKRPLAMTCRDALPLVLSLEKSAFRLSEQTPLNIFADDFAKVHGHPAREAQEFYDTHKSRTANLTLARSVILNGSMQELVECSTSWPYGAPFAINPRSFAGGGYAGGERVPQEMKECSQCGEPKLASAFGAQAAGSDSMTPVCKGKKVCSMCGEDKEFAAFNLDVKDNRLLSTCKDCLCKKEMTECSRCGDVKQPSAFCAETVGNDGILPVCKACLSKQETKECSECGIVKLPSAFCARAAGSDGMGPVCKACLSKQGKKGCSMCGEIKESAAFYLDAKTNRLSSACKDCNRKRQREKTRDAAAGKCCKRARCQDAEHAEPAQHSLYAEQAHGFPVQTQTTQVTPQQAQHGQHTLSAEPGQDKVVARQAPQESKKSSRGRPIKPKVSIVKAQFNTAATTRRNSATSTGNKDSSGANGR